MYHRSISLGTIASIKNVYDKDSYLFHAQVSVDKDSYIAINVTAK